MADRDFNADNRTDVLHLDDSSDLANVWLSNGDGTFNVRVFTPWPGYGMPNGIWLTGDYDNDGRTDAFHAVDGTDIAHVWLSNGDGTFRVTPFRPWEGYAIPNGVWLGGDFNADRRADVLHLDDANDLAHVWFSNGDGTFAVRDFSPWVGYGIPNGVWVTGDFDRDGRTDLLHAVDASDRTHVWLSNGDGTFRVNTFQPWPGYATPNGVWTAGDYDADGATDVLHATNGDLTHVWLSNADGTFRVSTFQPWRGYKTPNGQWFAGDYTLDGKADVVHVVDGEDFVHPWTSLLPGRGELFLQGLEVTQAVQSLAHDVPLVAGKTTIVRAYLDAPAESAPVAVQGVLSIRDLATGVVSLVGSTATTTLDPAQNGQLQTRRNALPLSLNFVLQPVFTTGNRQFSLSSVLPAAGGAPLPCSNCTVPTVSVPFLPSAPLRLRMVGLRYNTGLPPGTVQQPAPADFSLLQSWLGRAYPVAQVIATQTTILSDNGWPFTADDANAQLQAMRVAEVGAGMDERTHYLGLVSNGGGFMIGKSAGVPGSPDPSVVASGPVGNPAGPGTTPLNVAGDTDASFGDWYGGHELAHALGRRHPGFCNGNSSDDGAFPYPNGQISDNANTYVGFDAGDATNRVSPAALPGMSFDIMTYCNQPQWLSPYAYTGVRDRLNAENPAMTFTATGTAALVAPPPATPALSAPPAVRTGTRPAKKTGREKALPVPKAAAARPRAAKPAGRPANPAPALTSPAPVVNLVHLPPAAPAPPQDGPAPAMQEGQFVSIVATINLTRSTGKIVYVQHVPRALVPPAPAAGEQAILRFTSRSGAVLGEYPQDVRISSDTAPDEDRTGQIAAIVPELENVARIELLYAGAVLDRLDVPERAPKVLALRFLAPPARREPTLVWQGRTAGAAPLRYRVQVSPDGQTEWQVLAVGTTATELALTPEQWKQYAGWSARVIANDGYNDSDAETTRLGAGQE